MWNLLQTNPTGKPGHRKNGAFSSSTTRHCSRIHFRSSANTPSLSRTGFSPGYTVPSMSRSGTTMVDRSCPCASTVSSRWMYRSKMMQQARLNASPNRLISVYVVHGAGNVMHSVVCSYCFLSYFYIIHSLSPLPDSHLLFSKCDARYKPPRKGNADKNQQKWKESDFHLTVIMLYPTSHHPPAAGKAINEETTSSKAYSLKNSVRIFLTVAPFTLRIAISLRRRSHASVTSE